MVGIRFRFRSVLPWDCVVYLLPSVHQQCCLLSLSLSLSNKHYYYYYQCCYCVLNNAGGDTEASHRVNVCLCNLTQSFPSQ